MRCITPDINAQEKKVPMWIAVNGNSVECGYGETEKHDVEMSMNRAAMEDIINGSSQGQILSMLSHPAIHISYPHAPWVK